MVSPPTDGSPPGASLPLDAMKLDKRSLPIAVTVVLVLSALAARMDAYPLLDPDEGRNAEIAREMAVSNDYVLPRLNGLPYLDKPIVYFAAAAAFMEVLGPTAVAARLPALLFTLALAGVIWWFSARLFGRSSSWIAPVALASSPLTLGFARTVIFDSALTLFVVISLAAFYNAIEARTADRPDRVWTALAWSAMAAGMLTKGPVALAIPLMVAVPYAIWRGAARSLVTGPAILTFTAIILPWVFAVSRRIPDFVSYVVITETFERLTTAKLQRTGPAWYFLPIVLAGSFPWSLVCLGSWRNVRIIRQSAGAPDHRMVFLLIWILVPLVFFSLSQSKRPQYVLPLIPAIALLVANFWTAAGIRPTGARAASVALVVAGLALVVGHGVFDALIEMTPEVSSAIPPTAFALGAVSAIAGAAAWLRSHHAVTVALALSLPVASIPFVSSSLMDAIGRDRSARVVADAITPLLSENIDVVAVRTFPLSLPFYLRRQIILVTRSGAELTSNYLVREPERWAAQPGSLIRSLEWGHSRIVECGRPTLFVVRSEDVETRALLSSRYRLVVDSGRTAAYGPCGTQELARPRSSPPPGRRHVRPPLAPPSA